MKCVGYQPASQPTTRLSWKIGAKISWILVQKWPRKMTKVGWTPKSALKHFFSSKIPQDFELLEQVPESSYQTGFFWPETIYWDINFVVKCLPERCNVVLNNFEEYSVEGYVYWWSGNPPWVFIMCTCLDPGDLTLILQATIYWGVVSDQLWNAEKANSASAWLREKTMKFW